MLSNKIIYICNNDINKDFLSNLLGEDYKYIAHCFSVCDASALTDNSNPPLVIVAHEFVEDSIDDFTSFKISNPSSNASPLLLCDALDHDDGITAVSDGLFSDVIITSPLSEESKLLSILNNAISVCKTRAIQENNQEASSAVNDYILVIEDDDFFAEMYKISLSTLDEEVIVAVDCESASDILFERKPSLIFLDYNLPDFNGLEFFRTIKSDPNLQDVPVIIVTGEKQLELQEICMKLGAYKFIKKPIKTTEILKLVHELKH